MNTGKKVVLSLQHTIAMFGATVLVPYLTGINPSTALLTAGLGTLLFHLITGGQIPIFLGSSFAFIVVIQTVAAEYGMAYAMGGIMAAGAIYVIVAILVKLIGHDFFKTLFPPVVTGSVITVIGLTLAPTAIGMASSNWPIALAVFAIAAISTLAFKGFMQMLPILIAVVSGYVISLIAGIVDFAPIANAAWFGVPELTFPRFSWQAIAVIAPVAIVTLIEHWGDINANGAVVGRDFVKKPGLWRTILGDGLATMLAGALGGPANTTYSENTATLSLTGVYDPQILRGAAVFAIIIAFCGKLGGVIQSIPEPVMGGISILLFGMIASVGISTMFSGADMNSTRNRIIAAAVLVFGISKVVVPIGSFEFEGMSLATVVGAILNLVLPKDKPKE
ncbi:MAG: solute carrier family 23 protein [Firmicutes bacterium]|nr:solute carrier family 23 protein [Bacillota bacterium]MDD4336963.1 solute carrier family 23 protein [Bacillota bacterium]MDD4793086.1 solute carrier family 23 protein [Bacillota bacterium]